jgi:glycine/D-amino acid oxidase-like deaminating enzyme
MLGNDAGERLIRAAMHSADELFDIIKKYQIACDAQQPGWIRTAHYSCAAKLFAKQLDEWRQYGAAIETLDRSSICDLTGSNIYPMGALIQRGGNIHPLSYARGLARAASDAGAIIHNNSDVVDAVRMGDRWTLKTPSGSVCAGRVIIATNGYTGPLVPGLDRSIVPLISVQLATEPLGESLHQKVLPLGHTISDSRRVIYYGRKDAEGRFLLGGHGFTEQFANHADYERVKHEAVRIFPALKGIRWQYQWNGRLAITKDHLPHLHEPKPGILAGLGFNGRGVAMSNVMGRVMAEHVLGKPREELDIPITPITSYPLQRFYRIGLPLVIASMRLRDQIEQRRG